MTTTVQNGDAGNNTFTATAGDSQINGFAGIDTVIFNFRLVDANISFVGNMIIVDSATGHTVLTGIQKFQFTDGLVDDADGNPLVDDLFYYARYHDIWNAHLDADLHFAQSGWIEGRDPDAFFSTNLYLSAYPDIRNAHVNPLVHFDQTGWKEGRIPSINFDVGQYLSHNPDVAAAHVDPLAHFLQSGSDEGRLNYQATGPLYGPNGFDYIFYLQNNPDIVAAGVDPYLHFEQTGWKEGRAPNKYFDTAGYLATYTDVANAHVNPFDHYAQSGWKEGRNPGPAFDSNQYLLHNPDVAAAHVDPLTHYLQSGQFEGRQAYADPIFDQDGTADAVDEGAAVGLHVGIDASWGGWISPNLSYAITNDTSGGGFTIDPVTGVITVADSTKIDFETSPGHVYMVTVQASDLGNTQSQVFTIHVNDVVGQAPANQSGSPPAITEGNPNGTTVLTMHTEEPNGPNPVYSLTNNAGGRFTVDSNTGVVSIANTSLIDFETGAHSYNITGKATVNGVDTATTDFTITVLNANPSTPQDIDNTPDVVNEGAPVGTSVGMHLSSTDPNGPPVIWSILNDHSNGGFQIDSNGVVTVADPSKIDYETAPDVGHSYQITVQAADGAGGVTSQARFIVVNDVAPTTPVDTDGAAGGNVTEGAAAGTHVGITASATDINGPAVTWSLTDPTGGGFQIDAGGLVTVADPTKIDYETASGPGHSYNLTVIASDGTDTTSQIFNITVNNVAPTVPVDSNAAPDGVTEGAATGTLVGITASATDINGPPVLWSITADSSGGGFQINSGGVVSIANASLINYETSGVGHSYSITVQASDNAGGLSSHVFSIAVANVAPTTPVEQNDGVPGGSVQEGALANSTVGLTLLSTDPNGPNPVLWSLIGDSSGGGFTIDAGGVVRVGNASLLDFESTAPGHSYTITAQASDGAGGTSTQSFSIAVTNAPPSTPADTDGSADTVLFDAAADTNVGVTLSATDPNGGAVSYAFFDGVSSYSTVDPSGFFQVDASSGIVTTTAASVGNLVAGQNYTLHTVARDASLATSPVLDVVVHVQNAAPSTPVDSNTGNANQIAEGAAASSSTGLTAFSTSSNGPITYSISNDTSGGGFHIDPGSGIVTIANASLIDYEGAPAHAYSITVVADDGTLSSSQTFSIAVLDVAPSQPADADPSGDDPALTPDPAQGRVAANASVGANVGITAHATDVNGGTLTYAIVGGDNTHFAINANSGVVTLADATGLVAGAAHTITVQAHSTGGAPATADSATKDFVIEVVSAQPVVDLDGSVAGIDYTTTFTENGAAVAIADTDVTITDAGFTNLTSATVTLTNAQLNDQLNVGSLAGLGITANTVANAGTITVTLSGSAAFANYQTALQAITFSNGTDDLNATDRTVTVVVNDGTNPPSNAATATIHVAAINDAPSLGLSGVTPVSFTENGGPTTLFTSGSVSDPDNPANFAGGSYTVQVTDAQAGDEILVLASSGFSVSGSSLIFGGNVIGDIAFSLGEADVTNLTADATPTVVDALVWAFGFRNTSDDLNANTRHVAFTFNDGGNTGTGPGVSNTLNQTILVTAVNDAPVNHVPAAAQTVDTSGSFTFDVLGSNGIFVSDVDADGGSETVTLAVTAGTLTLSTQSNLTVLGDGTASVTLTGVLADINAALDGLTYAAGASPGTVTLTMTTDDNGNSPGPTHQTDIDTVQIVVTTPAGGGGPQVDLDVDDDNAPPGSTGYTTTFTEAGPAVAVVDTSTANDVAVTGTTATSATVVLVNAQTGDVLKVAGATGSGTLTYGADTIGWTINTATPGQITVIFTNGTGAPTNADYADALSQITFSNPDNNLSAVDRTLTFVLNDGTTDSNTAVATVHIGTVNDAPVVDLDSTDATAAGIDYATNYTYGATAVAVAGPNTVVTDPDTATIASATVTLTNASTGDTLAINGALPAGISAAITSGVGTITVTLTGTASHADYSAALQQVVFSNGDAAAFVNATRNFDVVVNDGTDDSTPAAHTAIAVANDAAPVAQDDSVSATEAGGVNNAAAGSNPSGNVITGTGSAGAVADTDADGPQADLHVTAVGTGTEAVPTGPGTVGTAFAGSYGSLILNADGSYSYAVDNTNAVVQALANSGETVVDNFNYTISDAFGQTDQATLAITIHGADDLPLAAADSGSMTEDAAGPTSFNVIANDSQDPDHTASNAITFNGAVTAAGNGPASTIGISASDVSTAIVGNQIQVTLLGGATGNFQKLAAGETATITIPYRLTGDAGETSDATLTVTVNGVNDVPVAVDDTPATAVNFTMTEDTAATSFDVLANDTKDIDHTAPNNITVGAPSVSGSASVLAKVSGADVTVGPSGVAPNQQVQVTLGANFQKLAAGETATIDVIYTLHGDIADAMATMEVAVSGVNDAPVIDLLSQAGLQTTGTTATFTEDGGIVTVAPQLTLSDVDTPALAGATVTLTNYQASEDVLTVANFTSGNATAGTVAGGISFTVSGGTVTFTNTIVGSPASVADYQAALRDVQYNDSSQNPNTTARTFSISTDDGQAANNIGSATATVTVTAVNDAPVNSVPGAQDGVSAHTDFAFSSANSNLISISDVDAGSGHERVQLSDSHGNLTVSLAGGATVFAGANGSHSVTLDGTVTQLNAALSTLVYHGDAAFTGKDTITVITNDQGNTPSPAQQDTDTIDVGVIPKVWFIDNTGGGSGGTGTSTDPFKTIADFNAAAGTAANDFVYLRTGTGTYSVTDGIKLKDGMTLVGGGDSLSFTDPLGGPDIVIATGGGTAARPTISVTNAGGIGIDVGSGNTIHGLNVATTVGGAIGIDDGPANASVGTLTISNMTVTGTGKAIDIDHGGTMAVTFDQVTSTGSTTQGMNFGGGLTGTVTVNNTPATSDIHGATGADINITGGGSLNLDYKGNITQANNAAMVNVDGGSAASGHTGTLNFTGTLSATNGSGLQFANGDGHYNFNTAGGSTALSGGAGVNITKGSDSNAGQGASGTYAFGVSGLPSTFAITKTAGTAFNFQGGNATIDYHGNITGTSAANAVAIDTHFTNAITFDSGSISDTGSGTGISVTSNTSGTVNFNDSTITLGTSGTSLGAGVALVNNTGATINFTPAAGNGLDIVTTGAGFAATGGGTVIVTGTGNTINSTNATALNVANTTIGAGGLNFVSISAGNNDAGADPVNGIILNTTGATAGLTITGDGGSTNNSSGGTIQHTTGAGISLTGTKGISLDQMNIHDTTQSGINGTTVTNFALTNSTINNSGAGAAAGSLFSNVQFGNGAGNNLAGTATITGNTLTNAFFSGVMISSNDGTISNANISNNVITSGTTTASSTGSGIYIVTSGTASTVFSMTAGTINNNQITNFPSGYGIEFQSGNPNAGGPGAVAGAFSGASVIEIGTNTIAGASAANPMQNSGILVTVNGSTGGSRSQGNFNIHNNTVSNVNGTAIGVGANENADLRAKTDSNTIHAHNTNASQGIGGGNGTLTNTNTVTPHMIWEINNNTIDNTDGSGILAVGRGTSGTLDLDVENNNVATPTSSTTLARRTIEIEAGNAVSANDTIHLQIFGNTAGAGLNGAGGIGVRKQGSNAAINVFGIFDAAGGPSLAANPTNAQVQAFIAALNPATALVDVLQGPGYQRDATHTDPLLAAAGGVAGLPGTAGTMSLTQAELDPIVAAAIAQWAAAGLTAEQLAALHATPVTIATLAGSVLGEAGGGAIQISPNAAGHGWFVDATPFDNAEFTHMLGTAGTDFLTDPTNAAAGHMDLLTTVVHEMGHVLGLADSFDPNDANDLMFIDLVAGERRLPGSADVDAAAAVKTNSDPVAPDAAAQDAGAPATTQTVVAGANLSGSAGADTFVVDASVLAAPAPSAGPMPGMPASAPIAHVADYSAAQGDTFDFSALVSSVTAGDDTVRVAEDASGTFATLQLNVGHWVAVAEIDGLHPNDVVNITANGVTTGHIAQIHADWHV